MKHNKVLLAVTFGMLAASSAAASNINYYVTGSFLTCTGCTFNTRTTGDTPPLPFGDSSPNNEIQFTNGGNTVRINYAFLGNAITPVNLNSPTLLSYGIFNVDSASNTPVNIGAFTFAMTVHDLTDAGTTVFNGSFGGGGQITNQQSTVDVTWVPSVNMIGSSSWSIFSPTQLVPENSTAGQTTIQGFVQSTVPEPMSMFLLGSGLLGIGFIARRKKLS